MQEDVCSNALKRIIFLFMSWRETINNFRYHIKKNKHNYKIIKNKLGGWEKGW